YDYTAYGSEGEFTLRRNRDAFGAVDLIPKAAIDAAQVDTTCELFGTRLAHPLLIAPTAGHLQLHTSGEVGTYRGATNAGATPFIVSHNASMPVDKI
ncbi:alpha-hydroxy-acid oxidizing protein, partial [Aeromonas veronii]|uniref:alpha-hydroxy-acid oxidizing protein n=1 Tax=Aeromonas veronii TaxID=654 RepID=UPI00214EC442